MNFPTWNSLYEAACAEMDREKASLNITWNDVFNPPAVLVMKVRASWWALGKSDNEIIAEAKRRYAEENGGS